MFIESMLYPLGFILIVAGKYQTIYRKYAYPGHARTHVDCQHTRATARLGYLGQVIVD